MIRPAGLKQVQGLMSVYQTIEKNKVPLSEDKAFLQKDAAASLYSANIQVIETGGRLYISSMWRSAQEQFKNWLDYQLGRKASYSPPPGCSMHECGRAIDIDTRSDQLKLSHERVREILKTNGWVSPVELGQPGDSHYEYRGTSLSKVIITSGYKLMVEKAFEEIKYKSHRYGGIDYDTDAVPQTWS